MTSRAPWDRWTIILTATLWAALFAGAWLLGHSSTSATPSQSGAVAVNSGLTTAPRAQGAAIPGLAAVPGAPGLATVVKAAAHPHPRRHATHAVGNAQPAVQTVAAAPTAPVAPVRRTPAVVSVTPVVRQPTTPVVTRPTPPATTPTHTTPPPTHTTPTGTGTVSGGG